MVSYVSWLSVMMQRQDWCDSNFQRAFLVTRLPSPRLSEGWSRVFLALLREATTKPIFDVAFSRCHFEVIPVSAPTLCHWTLDVERWAFDVCCLFRERFFIHYVRHLRWVAAVISFEDIDQTLDAASGHAFVGIDIQACDLRAASEVMKHATAVGDF